MKKILLVLFLAGCAAEAANKTPDAGVSAHAENQYKWYYGKYYPSCVQQCVNYTRSWECPEKCEKDFQQIKKVLIRAIRDNKEDDFAAVMEGWYGHE